MDVLRTVQHSAMIDYVVSNHKLMAVIMRYSSWSYLRSALILFAVIFQSLNTQHALASTVIDSDTKYEYNTANSVADLQKITNYIFWYEYFYNSNKVTVNNINGIDGMSDHGYTHELKSGGAISIFAEYATTENPRKDFLDTVRGCEKITGNGLFRYFYMCDDKITGAIASDIGLYTVTYSKDAAQKDWRWDWDTFLLIVETFRLIDGSEFRALYRALYPEVANPYKNANPHGTVNAW